MADLYRIYMDDSGNVDPHTTNAPHVRYGSVTAVILSDEYITNLFNPSFEALSKKHFGVDEQGRCHNIHRRLIARPPSSGPFSILNDEEILAKWNAESLSMLERAQYTVVTICIDKAHWFVRYPDWDGDFYTILVQAALERCFYFLKNRDGVAEFNIETKNAQKDGRIKRAYREAMVNGFEFISAPSLQKRFTSVEPNILTKGDCRPGVQLADLLAGPSLQHVRFIETKRHPFNTPQVVAIANLLENEKYYREKLGPAGYGRVWRPKP